MAYIDPDSFDRPSDQSGPYTQVISASATRKRNDNDNNLQTRISAIEARAHHEIYRMAADVTESANSFTDLTGLAFALAASEKVWFEAEILGVSASTGAGCQWGSTGPASPTYVKVRSYDNSTAGGYLIISGGLHNVFGQISFATTWGEAAGTIGEPSRIVGAIENGANAGTFQLQIRSSSNGTQVKAQKGSVLKLWRF